MKYLSRVLGQKLTYFVARIDRVFRAFVIVDAFHAMIHIGRAFHLSDYDASVDIATPKRYRFVTPVEARGEAHFEWIVNADGPCIIELYEGPTSSGAGSALTPRNRKRESSNTTILTVTKDSTVSAPGTQLEIQRLGIGGNPSKSAGGDSNGRHEWELNGNTIYEVVITPDSNGTEVWASFDWYEEIPSDEI